MRLHLSNSVWIQLEFAHNSFYLTLPISPFHFCRGLSSFLTTWSSAMSTQAARVNPVSDSDNIKSEKHVDPSEHPQGYSKFEDLDLVGKNGGEIFVEMMKQHDVKHIFGYPGGAILPIFDGIHGCKDFDFILPRHEQGGGHMAEGYARATGKPGVVVVTSGPGATNVITPMQDALSDGIPLVVFTGQVPTSAIGTDAFQEADVIGISRSCTKWNTMVKRISDLPGAIRDAFHIATTGRPGPVLVDLPKDVTSSTLQKAINWQAKLPYIRKMQRQTSDAASKVLRENAVKAADMINKAKRPIIYAGAGVLDCHQQLRDLAERGHIPCTTTLQAMGAFDEYSPLSVHMLGMHGAAYANYAMQKADCIIAIGARFDDRVTGNLKKFAPEAKRASMDGTGGIIHLEVQPKQINKTVKCDVPMVGDCGESLDLLLPLIEHRERKQWFADINEWKAKFPFIYSAAAPGGELKPQAVIEELNKQVEDYRDKVILTTGVGQHQMWATQYYRFRHPRQFITSGGLGTMGYGLPSAIGAQIGRPDHIVIDIDGDGSFSMTCMELITAAEFNIPVKILLLNNNFQGMVKQWQDLFYEERYSGTVMKNPDFVAMAKSMHCEGIKCTSMEDLPAAMDQFLKCEKPVVLECLVDKREHVYPMVPAGKALDEMVLASV